MEGIERKMIKKVERLVNYYPKCGCTFEENVYFGSYSQCLKCKSNLKVDVK
jgi:hypothetical protein